MGEIVPCAYLGYQTNGIYEVRCPFCSKIERHSAQFQEFTWVKSLCSDKEYKLMVDAY